MGHPRISAVFGPLDPRNALKNAEYIIGKNQGYDSVYEVPVEVLFNAYVRYIHGNAPVLTPKLGWDGPNFLSHGSLSGRSIDDARSMPESSDYAT